MVSVTKNIQLQEIKVSDIDVLHSLMSEIYPPAYQDLWKDNGDWYVQEIYSKENVTKELLEEKADYYFVVFNDKIIGNFRIIWDEIVPQFPSKKTVKLHRIYLHQNTQGKGIGKQLMIWLENKAAKKGYQILWLDVMDCKEKVFNFYKNLGFIAISHTFLPYNLLHKNVRRMSQVYKEI